MLYTLREPSLFSAAHNVAIGPSRHFAAAQQTVAFGCIATVCEHRAGQVTRRDSVKPQGRCRPACAARATSYRNHCARCFI
jgi:hypothetical protein